MDSKLKEPKFLILRLALLIFWSSAHFHCLSWRKRSLKCVTKFELTADTWAMSELQVVGSEARIQGIRTELEELGWRELLLHQQLPAGTEISVQKHWNHLKNGERARQLVKSYCCLIVYLWIRKIILVPNLPAGNRPEIFPWEFLVMW